MSLVQVKCYSCLDSDKIFFNKSLLTLKEKELIEYIKSNIKENKELYLFLLKDLGFKNFQTYIIENYAFTNCERLKSKFWLDDNTILHLCQKMLLNNVKKISIIKFILSKCIYNKKHYNTFEFYELINSVMNFSEEERKQVQKETLLLTFSSNDKDKAKEFIKMSEYETELQPNNKKYYYFYDICNYYSEVIYDNLDCVDYVKLKQLFLSQKQFCENNNQKLMLIHNMQNENSAIPTPKNQLEKQISTSFLALAIKNLDIEFAKILLSHCFDFLWCEEYEKSKASRIALIESCEIFADTQDKKEILKELKQLYKTYKVV